jgi:nucleoside-triphosphatase
MVKNLLITGMPGCGKTSLIKEILREFSIPAYGFFTEEIKEGEKRVGFKIVTLSGKIGILAKKGIYSNLRVSQYGVILKDLEEIGVKEIEKGLNGKNLIVIDEIGTMELFSERFKEVVSRALRSENKVLGTIKLKRDNFCDRAKAREDTKVIYLTSDNFNEVKEEIINWLKS